MGSHDWYIEYQIHNNRPGLLGDLASLLGMLSINIITINGVENKRRGMLLNTDDREKIHALKHILNRVDNITVTALRPPTLMDRMAVRHGRYLDRCLEDNRTYRFTREELGLLVDFMAELFRSRAPIDRITWNAPGRENRVRGGFQCMCQQALDFRFLHPAQTDGSKTACRG